MEHKMEPSKQEINLIITIDAGTEIEDDELDVQTRRTHQRRAFPYGQYPDRRHGEITAEFPCAAVSLARSFAATSGLPNACTIDWPEPMIRSAGWSAWVNGILFMPFTAGSFDTILATFSASFILDLNTWHEIARLLRQPNDPLSTGGRFVIVGATVAFHLKPGRIPALSLIDLIPQTLQASIS
jgi:hypothetical protein